MRSFAPAALDKAAVRRELKAEPEAISDMQSPLRCLRGAADLSLSNRRNLAQGKGRFAAFGGVSLPRRLIWRLD
jgi:hypothetical protein